MIAVWFLAILFSWFTPERGVFLIRNLLLPALLAYSGAWLMKRGRTYHTEELLLFVLAIWYIITRILNGSHYLETDADFACQLVVMAIQIVCGVNAQGRREVLAIEPMQRLFNGPAQGSLEYLENVTVSDLYRAWQGHMTSEEDEDDD